MVDTASDHWALQRGRVRAEADRSHHVEHGDLARTRVRTVRPDLAATGRVTRGRLRTEERLVIEKRDCRAVEPASSRAARRAVPCVGALLRHVHCPGWRWLRGRAVVAAR